MCRTTRATPWGSEHKKRRSPERAQQTGTGHAKVIVGESRSPQSSMNGTFGIDCLLRPYRAFPSCAARTECDRIGSVKGDAPGSHVVAPLGRRVTTRAAQIQASHLGRTTRESASGGLIKIGAKVVRHANYITFLMAELAVASELFAAILERIRRLGVPPPSVHVSDHRDRAKI